uniref:Uncharacterized protein n=1 Tax=Cacopsylla melanoneura TaxID=428564 RepID=A0A8D8TQS5_9HEMI
MFSENDFAVSRHFSVFSLTASSLSSESLLSLALEHSPFSFMLLFSIFKHSSLSTDSTSISSATSCSQLSGWSDLTLLASSSSVSSPTFFLSRDFFNLLLSLSKSLCQ